MRTQHGGAHRKQKDYKQVLVSYKNKDKQKVDILLPCKTGYFNGKSPTPMLIEKIQSKVGDDLVILLDIKGTFV